MQQEYRIDNIFENHFTLQVKILSLIVEGKCYRDILDCFLNVSFHCRTISKLLIVLKLISLQHRC